MGLHSRYRGLQSSPIHRPQSHHRLCQSTHSLPLTMKHRGTQAWRALMRRRRFIGHSDPYLFAYAPGRLSHRSDAALCFFASFPGQALHVVRTLVNLSVGGSPSLHRSALRTGNPRTEFHKGTLPLTREASVRPLTIARVVQASAHSASSAAGAP